MAVDSRDKRMSMLAFGTQIPWVMPNPNGSNMDATLERSQMLYLYAGISIQTGQPTMRRWGGTPHMRIQTQPFGRSW